MVNYNGDANTSKRVNRVLVVGTTETLQQQAAASTSFLAQTLERASTRGGATPVAFDGANAVLLQHAVAHLSPTTDNSATTQLLLVRNGAGALDVTLCALPTQVSRANALARPHSIHAFVKNNRALQTKAGSDGDNKDEVVLVVLVLPQHTETWYAAGAAVARAAPPYHNKQKKQSGIPLPDAAQAVELTDDQLEVVYEHALNEEEQALIKHTANGIQLASRLVDAPPNEFHTDAFVAEAQRVAKRTGSKITIIRGEELRDQGFGGLYGVGKASSHPPALVVVSHIPAGADANTKGVAMVGKGIVYDTGGLSIKISGFMVGMKRDMGGAAGLLGAFEAAVLSKNTTDTTPLHVVLCIAENAVGPLATRPDDVHTFYSGKTVEINNTDAEGRLVLADGVAYAVKHLNPKVLVDMATLTGAQGITTGTKIGCIYSNDEALEALAIKAGKESGDLVHPVPYAPEFFRSEFKSTVADMKNSVKNRANGQVSCAGQFIGNHLGDYENTGKWVHVDMAFPVKTDDDERSAGFGVAFIQSLLKQIKQAGW